MMGDTFRETVARELRDELEEFKLAFTIKTRTIETTREEQYLEELQ
ncbi:MAG: hypothetical protein GY938_16700 [Ketobacter sp.]|nr:hypothetical protein [Ketobacter sp.]